MSQWIKDLAAGHRTFAGKLADRQSLALPAEDPDYGGLGQAFPPGHDQERTRSGSHPKPEIAPPARPRTHRGPRPPTGKPPIDSHPVHTGTSFVIQRPYSHAEMRALLCRILMLWLVFRWFTTGRALGQLLMPQLPASPNLGTC